MIVYVALVLALALWVWCEVNASRAMPLDPPYDDCKQPEDRNV